MTSAFKSVIVAGLSAATLVACSRHEEHAAIRDAVPAEKVMTPEEKAQEAAEQARFDANERHRSQARIAESDADIALTLARYPNLRRGDLYMQNFSEYDSGKQRKILLTDEKTGEAMCKVGLHADNARADAYGDISCKDLSEGYYQIDRLTKAAGMSAEETSLYKGSFSGVVKDKAYCVYTGDATDATCESVIAVDKATLRLKACLVRATGIQEESASNWHGWTNINGQSATLTLPTVSIKYTTVDEYYSPLPNGQMRVVNDVSDQPIPAGVRFPSKPVVQGCYKQYPVPEYTDYR